MKILIVAGGGGHFSPALAVIDDLPKEWEILVIGRKYTFEGDQSLSFEYQTAQKFGFPFVPLTTGRLQRSFTRYTILSLLKIPIGFFQALSVIRKFKPDVVLSFGGYVSFPVAFAAYVLRIPIVIHEQTLYAGLANKIVARIAKKVCISWQQSYKFFPKSKVVLTGNPLRKEFIAVASEPLKTTKTLPAIYITGGSSGSHTFNVFVEGCLERLLKKYIIIHQTGDAKQYNDFERLQKLKDSLPAELRKRYVVAKFIDNTKVADFIKQADLVVSRAGINTITELLYLGKPCLLIPLPYGQHHEQLRNALFVKEAGLAEVTEQHVLSSESFYNFISAIMANLHKYKKQENTAKKLIDLQAAQKIIGVISDVYKQN